MMFCRKVWSIDIMKTYKTRAEYLADCTEKRTNSHRPPAKPYRWTCADCGAVFADTVSYGIFSDSMVCYSCCHARDVTEMRDRTKPFCAYISSDNLRVSNWPGAKLGDVVSCSNYRNNIGARIYCYSVRDIHGKYWHGRNSGAGMCILLRASKG